MAIVCEDVIIRKLKNGKIKKGYYMHDTLKDNLEYELKRVEKNWDSVILYDGEEGAAKTTVACANAYYLSYKAGLKFDINNIVFTQSEFMKLVDIAKPKTNIVWDEFVLSGLNLEALSMLQITLIKKMTIIRKKRLIIHLIIPYMFMLTKYFAIARTRCLIHVYSNDNLTRGDFLYYNKPSKRRLYITGKKFWEYGNTKSDFNGDFTNTFGLFFNIDEYEKRKDEATQKITHDYRQVKAGESIYKAIMWLKANTDYTNLQIGHIFGWQTHKGVEYYIKRYSKEVQSYENTSENGVLRMDGAVNINNKGNKKNIVGATNKKGAYFDNDNEEFEDDFEADRFKKELHKQNVFDIT